MNVPPLIRSVLAVVIVCATAFEGRGQDVPATQPTVTRDAFVKEINAMGMALLDVMPADEAALKDPVKRAEVGQLAIPIVKKALAAIDRAPLTCGGGNMSPMKAEWEPMLIFFGDEEFTRLVQRQAAGNDEAAFNAQLNLALANAALAMDDKEKTESFVKKIVDLARQKPESERATLALIRMKDDERLGDTSRQGVQSALDQATSPTAISLRPYLTTKPAP
ncbi:MAG TPA: hypothetical protein VGN72_07220 [Tepidisphaeraceae bacterium]|jgi:hypothetical protein|nr:hypothetical protein [Tepidisphaeraceae bacterium]